jgi:hypothetical protein
MTINLQLNSDHGEELDEVNEEESVEIPNEEISIHKMMSKGTP